MIGFFDQRKKAFGFNKFKNGYDVETNFYGKKNKKSKQGTKQFAMRKGTIKMIDELKNFEGFSNSINPLKNFSVDSQKAPKKARAFPQAPWKNTNKNKFYNLNYNQQKNNKEANFFKTFRTRKVNNFSINLNPKQQQQKSVANSAKKKKMLKADLIHSRAMGYAVDPEEEIEKSIECENENEKKYSHGDYNYEAEEEKLLIDPKVYKKIMQSSIFVPAKTARDFDFDRDESPENVSKSKKALNVVYLKGKGNQIKPIPREDQNKENEVVNSIEKIDTGVRASTEKRKTAKEIHQVCKNIKKLICRKQLQI